MELEEKINLLENEKQQYIVCIENLNAEKLALDQMCMDSLKNVLNLKKEIILLTLNLNKEKESKHSIQKELEDIKNQLKEKDVPIEF